MVDVTVVDVTVVDVTVVVHHERHRDGVVAVLLGAAAAVVVVDVGVVGELTACSGVTAVLMFVHRPPAGLVLG